MRVFIYFNLHRKCWSVKALEGSQRGRVVAHAEAFKVEGAAFKVSEAGRQRVIREQRKNVHAGVVGKLVDLVPLAEGRTLAEPQGSVAVTYNPYKGPTFVTRDLGEPVRGAGCVVGNGRRVVAGLSA